MLVHSALFWLNIALILLTCEPQNHFNSDSQPQKVSLKQPVSNKKKLWPRAARQNQTSLNHVGVGKKIIIYPGLKVTLL